MKEQEIPMKNQVIRLVYSQGEDNIIYVDRKYYKSNKEMINSINKFIFACTKYYMSGQLLSVSDFILGSRICYINLNGIRKIYYTDIDEYIDTASNSKKTLNKGKNKNVKTTDKN